MISTAYYSTSIGLLALTYTEQHILRLQWLNEEPDWSCSVRTPLSERAIEQVRAYLSGNRTHFDLPLLLQGSDFQKQVWKALLDIPYGETRTYKQIAEAIGNPKAARAVGMANNKNPLPVIVPCHRVIGSKGQLVGYAGGLEMKRQLLKIEDLFKGTSIN